MHLGAVREIIVTVESNKYYILLLCAFSITYPAGKAHSFRHIVMCDLSGSNIIFQIIS